MARLGREFFEGDTVEVSRRLLGCVLVRAVGGQRIAGRIVEVEAYRGAEDPASHAYGGMTRRNRVMFGEPGRAYVYFTMGMHWCLNVTTEEPGKAGAALLRALEPLEGIDFMMRLRGQRQFEDLTNGPAKLTQALKIDGKMNGEDLAESPRLFLERGPGVNGIGVSSRVGISRGAEHKWRFFEKGNKFVSKGKPSA
jgi:DNA-3-methyladenine glycosylase